MAQQYGTARYLARHSMFRTLGTVVGGAFRVAGMALIVALLWLALHPWLAFWLLLALWLRRMWRRSRLRPAPITPHDVLRLEHARLRNALLRARIARLQVEPLGDVARAERDYRRGRASALDVQTAIEHDLRRNPH